MPGFPPPPDLPPPAEQDVVDITAPDLDVQGKDPCSFSFSFTPPKFSLNLPGIFPIPLPSLKLALTLSCKLPNPIDVTKELNLPFGGGRPKTNDVDPDTLDDAF